VQFSSSKLPAAALFLRKGNSIRGLLKTACQNFKANFTQSCEIFSCSLIFWGAKNGIQAKTVKIKKRRP